MKSRVVRITAVPRSDHMNSGLQALTYAAHFGDEVWALPAPGAYIGSYGKVRAFLLDNDIFKKYFPIRLIRTLFLAWVFFRVALSPSRLFIVHSFVFALPLWLLRRNFCLVIHGSDRRFLTKFWGGLVAKSAICVLGVGFSGLYKGFRVLEIPNIFVPARAEDREEIQNEFLFVLRNAPVKNPFYPIMLAQSLGSNLNGWVTVAGVDVSELPTEERAKLQRLVNEGIKIRYVGRLQYNQVVEHMSNSKVLMVPSFSEGLPKAILEGMFQGNVVVVNEDLKLPQEIDARVVKVRLDDWAAIDAVAKQEWTYESRCANRAFAEGYLHKSQKDLLDLYERLYVDYGAAKQ